MKTKKVQFESPEGAVLFDLEVTFNFYQDDYGVDGSEFTAVEVSNYKIYIEGLDVTEWYDSLPSKWQSCLEGAIHNAECSF
jgi:hypothetical protein